MMSNRFLSNSIFYSLLFIITSGCSTTINDKNIVFIGDSIVSGWDVECYFPYLIVNNNGLFGAKIKDICVGNYSNKLNNSDIVILAGTNDIAGYKYKKLPVNFYDSITAIYKNKILSFGASRTIIISVLPRSDTGSEVMNGQIVYLNTKLLQMTKEVPNIIFLDVFSDFTDKNGLLNFNYSADGVHINSFGYELLSSKLSSIL